MKRKIGYYVHHQGDGHRQRALAIAAALPGCFTLLGTGISGKTENTPSLELPADYPGSDNLNTGAGESLHYAPRGHDGIRQRIAMVSDWIAREKPVLIVVDVSIEIAMLVRLTSTPMVYVRLSGTRCDQPHLDAFRAAVGIIAPFHRDLDDPDTAPWVQNKTTYIPGLSRAYRAAFGSGGPVLAVSGKGGDPLEGSRLAAAAAATPDRRWRAIGPVTPPDRLPENLVLAGWVENADEEIARAGVVIGHAGDGLVNAVIAAGRSFICLPQKRNFNEQMSKAKRLQALGAAVVLETWPAAQEWPRLLRRAQNLDPGVIHNLHDPNGPAKAASFLKSLAQS